jgi:hypothetical protein
MRSPSCLCVCALPLISFLTPKSMFIKLEMYVMTPEPISMKYFLNPSHQSVCLHVHPSYRYWAIGKHVSIAINTRNNRRIIERECLWACISIPLLLLGNYYVNTFPRQWRIVTGVVFYVVRAVSNESRRLVLPRAFCCVCLFLSLLMLIL